MENGVQNVYGMQRSVGIVVATTAVLTSVAGSVLSGRVTCLQDLKWEVCRPVAILSVIFFNSHLRSLGRIAKKPVCLAARYAWCVLRWPCLQMITEMRSFAVTAIRGCRQNYLTVAGLVAGNVVGAIANYSRSESLFARNYWECFREELHGFPWLRAVNDWRERAPFGLAMGLPIMVLAYAVENIASGAQRAPGAGGLLAHAWRNLTALPLAAVEAFGVASSAWILRERTRNQFMAWDVDTSGHAIIAFSLAYGMARMLSATRPIFSAAQHTGLKFMIGLGALTDLPWAFTTIASCHSIADVSTGVCMVALSCFGIHLVKALGASVLQKTLDAGTALFNRVARLSCGYKTLGVVSTVALGCLGLRLILAANGGDSGQDPDVAGLALHPFTDLGIMPLPVSP